MGHRIELGEIETALERVEGMKRGCCIYDEEKNKIVVFYEGELEKRQIVKSLGTALPAFMVPNVFIKMDRLPITNNGKIDRKGLKTQYKEGLHG